MTEFRDLGLSEPTLRGLAGMGFDEATPVQARAIPCLLEGRDVVAQALTGTGKTAAYGVPIVERVDPKRVVPQAIVVVPTRELAVQVTEQLVRMGQYRRLSFVPIYGGQPIGRQLQTLRRGVHVVVATPGRLMDHMRRGTVDLSNVMMVVLDEADQMLEMGFVEDIEYVLAHLPEGRVTALFSATMPEPIVQLSRKFMRDPEMIRLSPPRAMTVPEIDQVFYQVPFHRKHDALCRVLQTKWPERAIVFCATKRMVDEVMEQLQARGYLAEGLHGDMTQATREKVLRGFRAGRVEVLVATDVAARGLDIPEVSHVINFDIPPDPEYYVHRIGRTARFGRHGEAITFVNPHQMRELRIIERMTGARIRRDEVPTEADAEQREMQVLEERLLASLASGTWARYRTVVEEILDDHDPVDVAAAALALVVGRRPAEDGAPPRLPTAPATPAVTATSTEDGMQPAPRLNPGSAPNGRPAGPWRSQEQPAGERRPQERPTGERLAEERPRGKWRPDQRPSSGERTAGPRRKGPFKPFNPKTGPASGSKPRRFAEASAKPRPHRKGPPPSGRTGP